MDVSAEGSPCWADATLPDLRAGERFYGELFGWTFTEGGAGTNAGTAFPRHSRALLDGRPVAALVAKRDGRMPTAWGVHLATPDLGGTVEKVEQAGGTLLSGPTGVAEYGRSALVADPDGAVFAVWQGGKRPGFGATDVPGAFCWTEVYVRNAAAADAFYPAVFGYELQDPPFDAGDFKTWTLPGPGPRGREVGGRAIIGDVLPAEMPPHFLVYFRVGDVGDAARTVRSGGGRVLVDRQEIPGATFAVVMDNQGAVFAVMDGESGPDAEGGADTDAESRAGTDTERSPEADRSTGADARSGADTAADRDTEPGTDSPATGTAPTPATSTDGT